MPIRGLTDQVLPRFPSLGKLRKGGAKESKNGREVYGRDLNYFRFTSERPEIVKAFADAYGEQPVALHVYLPYAKLDDNFATWKEAWAAGGLQHRCDGETCTIWYDKPTGKYRHDPVKCPGGCDEVGRLTVILPQLLRAGYVGYVTLETHSLHDIMNITASLLAVVEARTGNELGLRGIEFVLRRKPEMVSTPGWGANEGKRQRVEKWLVSIEPVPTWAETQLQLAAPQPAALMGESTVATAHGFVDEATGEILEPPEDAENGDYELMGEEAPAPASETQVKNIQDLAARVYTKPEDKATYRAWLKNTYKVVGAKDLTGKQADDVIAALNDVLARAGNDGQDQLPM